MATLSCYICLKNFSKKNRTPKILNCGHTSCHLCLCKLMIQSKKYCPTCKVTLTKPLEEYATNFIVLNQIEVSKENATFSSHHVECTLKKIEELIHRNEMLMKNVGKNVIINELTKLKQMMMEMNVYNLNSTEAKKIVVELENDEDEGDTILYCSGKSDVKPTYSLNDYKETSRYLNKIASCLQKGEEIYSFKLIQFSKPKYGKVTLNKDRIDIHALDLPTVDKNASIVSFEDLRKCITSQNFRTFVSIDEQTISFSIIDSSYLASRFIKLCSGETGPMFKGANGTTPTRMLQNSLDSMFMDVQTEYLFIKNYNGENENFDDYDLNIFTDERETSCSTGDVVVQMFSNGQCQIRKCVSSISTFTNVVAKASSCSVPLYGDDPVFIRDSGISIIFKL